MSDRRIRDRNRLQPQTNNTDSLQPDFQGTLEGAIDIGRVTLEGADGKIENASNILGYQRDYSEGLDFSGNRSGGDTPLVKEITAAPVSVIPIDGGIEVVDSAGELQLVGPEVPAYEGDASDGEECFDGIDSGFERMGTNYMGENIDVPEKQAINPMNAYELFVSRCSSGSCPFEEAEVDDAYAQGVIGKNDRTFLIKLKRQQDADERSGAKVTAARYAHAYFKHLKEGRFLGGKGGAFIFNYMCKVLALKNHPFGLRMNHCDINEMKLSTAVLSDLVLIRVNIWKGSINLSHARIARGHFMSEVLVKNGDIDETCIRIGTGQFMYHVNIPNGSFKQKRGVTGLKSSSNRDPKWGVVEQCEIKVGKNLLQDDMVCAEQRQCNIHVGGDFLHSNVDTRQLVQRNVSVDGYYRPLPIVIPSQCIRRINVRCSDFDWSTEDSGSNASVPPRGALSSAPESIEAIEGIELPEVEGNLAEMLVDNETALQGGASPTLQPAVMKPSLGPPPIKSKVPPIPKRNKVKTTIPPIPVKRSARSMQTLPPKRRLKGK